MEWNSSFFPSLSLELFYLLGFHIGGINKSKSVLRMESESWRVRFLTHRKLAYHENARIREIV